jgi:hypothetical protein
VSNQFALFPGVAPSALDLLAAARYRQREGPYAPGRALYDLQRSEANLPRGTSYALDYARPAELAAMRRAEVAAQLDALDAIQALDRAQAEALRGQIKEAARSEQVRRTQSRITQRAFAGSAVAGAGNALVGVYADLWYQQSKLRERRKRTLAVGRRGAAATRPLSPTAAGLTNRTGAKSTRAAAVAAGPAEPTRASAAAAGRAKSAAAAGSRSGSAASTGKQRVESRATVGQAQTQVQRTVQRSRLGQLFTQLLSPIYPPPRVVPRAVARTPVRAAARAILPTSTSALVPTAQGLTSLQQQGVGSPPQRCKCPEPKKERPGEKRCRNPVISTTIRDNVLTTKRELKCPPSKPK